MRILRLRTRPRPIASEWFALALIVFVVAATYLSFAAFNRQFTPTVPVTLTSNRSGLAMEPNAKVKMRGVQVGRVANVSGGSAPVRLTLDLDPAQIANIPANIEARIDSTTLFGSKFVELVYPANPSTQHLSAGATLKSQNVAVEVNTVFQNLVSVLKKIDPAKLNATLSAISDGLDGQGEALGQSIDDTNAVLSALIPRFDTIRDDWKTLAAVTDIYSAAAPHLINFAASASATSATLNSHDQQFESLLLNVAGFSRTAGDFLSSNKQNLQTAVNTLQPTTTLLQKYDPELTCLLVGANNALPDLAAVGGGANGKSVILDAAILLGDDAYRYPDNLPIVAAKGGPGGKPGCGSLPDVAKNWPQQYLVTNTGYGTGLDIRPNPGIGFPGYANYLPVTRAVPEPPSIRYPGGPAPGPIPYPGAPPYGAPLYGPGGVPLFPGVPPASPPVEPAPAGP